MALANQCCCQQRLGPSPFEEQGRLRGKPAPRTRASRIFHRALSMVAFALALLIPKCPLCLVGWAAALGVGATWQHYLMQSLNPWTRAVLLGLLMFPLLLQLMLSVRWALRRLGTGPNTTVVFASGMGKARRHEPKRPKICILSRGIKPPAPSGIGDLQL